ncbi:MAG: MlaD family protein [Chiayiivirga sp.]|jgi:phospholipid/cholesterol/gamma-HCH transport system substrate-binding protein|uniref:MlaD family protein n=1 Tax=Chiayiivirga sp. TaxID=2041042 RepID=UPI0025BAA0E7|nr:MlaD family protein [Chiayiivirga sp.]MCI1710723.1 MlaD family protein [Chiayiivirga sp.]MCI1728437.1 MlaD family protein [Chiayiivirga sp.]
MKRDSINYVLVGVAVLVAFGLLLATLMAITGRGGSSSQYHVYYDNVTGLGYGAPVFYEGFRIGQVAGIEPERGEKTRYKVELALRSDWAIPADSVARLQSSGLLADTSVGIREGQSRVMLEPGAEIAGTAGGDVFAAMNDLAGELTILARDRVRPLVDKLATRLDSISGTIDSNLPALVNDTRELMQRLNQAADGVNGLLDKPNQEAIAASLQDVRKVAAELHTTQQRADALLASLNATVEENRPELRQTVLDLEQTVGAVAQRIDAITHHLESSSRNLDEFAREIRRNPNRLLFTPSADEVEPE